MGLQKKAKLFVVVVVVVISAMQPRGYPPNKGGFSNLSLWDMLSVVGMVGVGDKRNLDVKEKKRTQKKGSSRNYEERPPWRSHIWVSQAALLMHQRAVTFREAEKVTTRPTLKDAPISPTVPSDWRDKARRGNRWREEKTEHSCLPS